MVSCRNCTQAEGARERESESGKETENNEYESIQFVPINLVNVTIKVSRKRQLTPK